MLLYYAHTYPNAKIRYQARYMILHVKLDTDYLFMPGARSCISGQYHLSDHPTNPTNPSYVNPNGPILTECKTLQYLVISTVEYDTGGISTNIHNIVSIIIALLELDHLQHKTPLKTDNSTSKGYSPRSIRKKRSK